MPNDSSILRNGKASKQFTTRTCEHCGRTFTARIRADSPGTGRYCSRSCFARARNGTLQAWMTERRIIDETTGCWLYTRPNKRHGYGMVTFAGKQRRLPRVVMHLLRGFDLDSELDVLHRCDRPACFNPDHLFIGTAADNSQDMMRKGRHFRGSTTPWAKLTEADVLDIRARCAAGETFRSIAADYGIVEGTVSDIKRRKSWTHLP